jgi:integrase
MVLEGVPLYYEGSDRHRVIWHAAEVAAFCESAGMELARAVQLMAQTGLRPGDLVRLTRNHVRVIENGERVISLATNKSRQATTVQIPVTEECAAILDATPADRLLILQSPRGEAWTEENLSHAVGKHLEAIGLRNGLGGRLGLKRKGARRGQPEHLTLYDLRGTALTRLMRHGFTVQEAATHMCWKPSYAAAMLDIYMAEDPEIATAMFVKLQPASPQGTGGKWQPRLHEGGKSQPASQGKGDKSQPGLQDK